MNTGPIFMSKPILESPKVEEFNSVQKTNMKDLAMVKNTTQRKKTFNKINIQSYNEMLETLLYIRAITACF